MLEEDGKDFSRHWGYLSRAGLNDKSQFTRQIEKYADIYTSRVSNFLRYTPFAYFRLGLRRSLQQTSYTIHVTVSLCMCWLSNTPLCADTLPMYFWEPYMGGTCGLKTF